MRIVTVARKPLAAEGVARNCLEHATGALNIDACRVASGAATPSVGRWPANVVLMHLDACEIVGSRKVKTGTAHREQGGGNTIFSDTKKKPLPDMTYADEDGMETVPDWRCAEGCPVAELDAQSGELQSGSGTVKRKSAANREGNRSSTYGAESRQDGRPEIFYGDRGGASRFFKNFGGKR
jgi:hypothetical protein